MKSEGTERKSKFTWLKELLPRKQYRLAMEEAVRQNSFDETICERKDALALAFNWLTSELGQPYWFRMKEKYFMDKVGAKTCEPPVPFLVNICELVVQEQVPLDDKVRMLRINGAYCDSSKPLQE